MLEVIKLFQKQPIEKKRETGNSQFPDLITSSRHQEVPSSNVYVVMEVNKCNQPV